MYPRKREDNDRYYTESTYGDCLEAIGIPSRAIMVADRNIRPVVGDLVHCCKIAGALSSYIKDVESISDELVVRTHYVDSTKDFRFVAEEVLGVVVEVRTLDGDVVYRRK
jgi:hypothetical protein